MPEISVIHIIVIAVALIAGLVSGWVFRGRQAEQEKAAVNGLWQEQFDAQRQEHERLVSQNRSLMEQNSQYQASNRDSKMRAAELSGALKEAFERRDQLQRQIKDIRSNLELAMAQRNQLESDMRHRHAEVDATAEALKRRDDRIARLSKELAGWQERVPPLIERFRARNEEALRLEEELSAARERVAALEALVGSDETRVEPLDRAQLEDDLDASNDALQQDEDEADRHDGKTADDDGGIETSGAGEPASALADEDLVDQIADARERDDLKMIKGVGPAIEKTLNEMGIRNFEQIAAMSEYDIDRIARRLKGFRTRIYREDWMGQARDLHDRKRSQQG